MRRCIEPDAAAGGAVLADGHPRRAKGAAMSRKGSPVRALPVRLSSNGPSGGQGGCQHAADAAFAVCAGHVNAGICLPRVAKKGRQAGHPSKPGFIGIPRETHLLHRLKAGKQRIQALIILF